MKVLDFSPGSTVLDIRAGPGTLAVPLAKYQRRVTVVESSKPMIYLENVLIKGDVDELKFQDIVWMPMFTGLS